MQSRWIMDSSKKSLCTQKRTFLQLIKEIKCVEGSEILVHNLTDYHTCCIWLKTNCCLLNPFKNFSSPTQFFTECVLLEYTHKANHWKCLIVHVGLFIILCVDGAIVVSFLYCVYYNLAQLSLLMKFFICFLPPENYIARVRARDMKWWVKLGNGSGSVKKALKRIWHEN